MCGALGIVARAQITRIKRDEVMAEHVRFLRIDTPGEHRPFRPCIWRPTRTGWRKEELSAVVPGEPLAFAKCVVDRQQTDRLVGVAGGGATTIGFDLGVLRAMVREAYQHLQ